MLSTVLPNAGSRILIYVDLLDNNLVLPRNFFLFGRNFNLFGFLFFVALLCCVCDQGDSMSSKGGRKKSEWRSHVTLIERDGKVGWSCPWLQR